MARNGIARVETQFRWEDVASEIEDLYEDVLARTGDTSRAPALGDAASEVSA
jgi:hypothetical protein